MFIKDGKRFNIHASATFNDVTYANFLDATVRQTVGITEIQEPARESSETHNVREIDDAPYIINEPKTPAELNEIANTRIKQQIAAIEAGQARAVREAALGNTTYLTQTEAQIQVLRDALV